MVEPAGKVDITPRAEDVLRRIIADLLLGHLIEDTPFWIGADQYHLWRHTQLTVDVTEGRGSGFSLEAPEGVRFLIRSDMLTCEQPQDVEMAPPSPAEFPS